MKATIHVKVSGGAILHHIELPDDMPHAEAWEKCRSHAAELGLKKHEYRITGILTDRQRQVLAFLEKHGRCTVTHLAHHFGCDDPLHSGPGYVPLLAILKKLKYVRETEYLGHRTYIPFNPNPRFPRG